MLVLAVENSASMFIHHKNLYDLYLDQLLDTYLDEPNQKPKMNSIKKLVLFSSFQNGQIHFKTSEKAKIKNEYGKLEMTNGQVKTTMINSFIRNLHACLKYDGPPAGEPIHIIFVTCSIPIINHTSHKEKKSAESLLVQDLAKIATVSIISPFTKNIMSACRKMQNPADPVNHSNLFLFFQTQQNVWLENNQYSVLLHPDVAQMIKLKNSTISTLPTASKPPATALSSSHTINQQQPISAPISAASPSAYPPPSKFNKDIGKTPPNTTFQAPITKSSPVTMNQTSSNNPIMMNHQKKQQINPAASVAAMNATMQQQKMNTQQQQQQQQMNLAAQQQQQQQINLAAQLQQQQQQQQQVNLAAQLQQQQQMKTKQSSQSPFIPQGNLNSQAVQNQQHMQLKNMYQQSQVDPNNNNNQQNFVGNNFNNGMLNQSIPGVGNVNFNSMGLNNMQLQLLLQQQISNNQMQMGNSTSFLGANVFSEPNNPMLQQSQPQQQRQIMWSGLCKFSVPQNNLIVFMASASPQRNRNVSEFALNTWPQNLFCDQYIACNNVLADNMASQENVLSVILLPNQQSAANCTTMINYLTQTAQAAVVRFANMTSGMIVIPRQSQLYAFLFLQEPMLDQAIEKIGVAQGNINLQQQSAMNQLQGLTPQQQMQYQQLYMMQQGGGVNQSQMQFQNQMGGMGAGQMPQGLSAQQRLQLLQQQQRQAGNNQRMG